MTAISSESSPSKGKLIPLLIAFFYIFFTLIPNSHSLMVQWPWVLFWQIGLICPIIWLIWLIAQGKFQRLGLVWDSLVVLMGLGLVISAVFAEFPQPAKWYSWSALGYIAALYGLTYRQFVAENKQNLLIFQGYLSFAFILISLILWIGQTLIPELSRLNRLKQAGIEVVFDFSDLVLRNWVPLGHQNYVAGYLLLVLPLLAGLSLIHRGWLRKLWIIGFILGLIDLYTTSSRGGLLGLLILCGWGIVILLVRSRLPKKWIGLGGLSAVFALLTFTLLNNRFRILIFSILQGKGGGELGFRYINGVIGWNMGKSNPFTGAGLGNVPQLYQKYRPFWAGRESEMVFQLHSTPVQLWAEMGLWGILGLISSALGLIWLIYQFIQVKGKNDISLSLEILFWCLTGGLLAYGVMSLTDYQLDNIAISGIIVIYLASLRSFLPSPSLSSTSPIIAWIGIGLLFVVSLWLLPIHRAWQLSSQGFTALEQKKIDPFVQFLSKSHELAPWEAYYPYQLGWNLGNFALESSNFQEREQYLNNAINWFDKGNIASPYQEFGRSNRGWLSLQQNAREATSDFGKAVQLVPAKRGLMYGLGLSLLIQQKSDYALESLSLEALRDPVFITSPIWRSTSLQGIYTSLLNKIIVDYDQLLQQKNLSVALNTYLHRCRGTIYWWQGNIPKAEEDWQNNGNSQTNLLLKLSRQQTPPEPLPLLIQAWFNPAQRREFIQQAWMTATKTELNPTLEENFLESMKKTDNFDQWLRKEAPILRYRRERLGFGVNMRHIDGVIPKDFLLVLENAAIKPWFSEVFYSSEYDPDLDKLLQPLRENLLKKIESLE